MCGTISAAQVRAAIERAIERMIALGDELNRLDAAIGDGDTGLTVAKGAAGLRAYLASTPSDDDVGGLLAAAGMAFNRAAPSTMGALMAAALVRAGREAKGMAALDGPTLARMLLAADQGVQERGKAQPGDKTIVDALHPAAAAFAATIERGAPMAEAATTMLKAAEAGRDAVIPLQSRRGRASWVGVRTVGQPDPGAVLFVEVLEAVVRAEPRRELPGKP